MNTIVTKSGNVNLVEQFSYASLEVPKTVSQHVVCLVCDAIEQQTGVGVNRWEMFPTYTQIVLYGKTQVEAEKILQVTKDIIDAN